MEREQLMDEIEKELEAYRSFYGELRKCIKCEEYSPHQYRCVGCGHDPSMDDEEDE